MKRALMFAARHQGGVFVAQHGSAFGLEDKARRAAASPATNPFVDPDGYQRFVQRSEQSYLKQLAADQKAAVR